MHLDQWFPWYNKILDEFGFSRVDDELSAGKLDELLQNQGSLKPEQIEIEPMVIIFGAGPSLKKNVQELKSLNLDNFTFIAADGASTALQEEKITPHIIVTDLDGKIDDIIESNKQGSTLVIHAHGNNIDKIENYVPKLHHILGTTQSTPLENVYNFGGFTDGDRCIYLASALGAKLVFLAGMDFGKTVTRYSRPDLENSEEKADNIKQKKLEFAKDLTEWAADNEKIKIISISKGEKLKNIEYMDAMLLENI